MFPVDPLLFASLAAALFGLVVGSFANVCIHRIPLDESIVFPASRCPRCGSAIAPWHNVPIAGWLWLRGRCASCREPISPRYPLVEAAHGAAFCMVVLTYGLSPFTPVLCAFVSSMMILALIDWDHKILPDRITIPGTVLGVATTFVPGALVDWRESLLAAGLGFAGFFLVAEGYSRLRGVEGLGMGDWKLAAFMGSVLGGQALLLVVFLGSLAGTIYGLIQATRQRREALLAAPAAGDFAVAIASSSDEDIVAVPKAEGSAQTEPPAGESVAEQEASSEPPSIGKYKLPFGTFLAGAAIYVLFFGAPTLRWYSSLFRQ